MTNLDMPATMPGTMKEQLQALAPYMVDHALKANGGWWIRFMILIANFNHKELAYYGMVLNVTVEQPEMSFDGPCGVIRQPRRYADVELTYK
jgi:hypothetical protein